MAHQGLQRRKTRGDRDGCSPRPLQRGIVITRNAASTTTGRQVLECHLHEERVTFEQGLRDAAQLAHVLQELGGDLRIGRGSELPREALAHWLQTPSESKPLPLERGLYSRIADHEVQLDELVLFVDHDRDLAAGRALDRRARAELVRAGSEAEKVLVAVGAS